MLRDAKRERLQAVVISVVQAKVNMYGSRKPRRAEVEEGAAYILVVNSFVARMFSQVPFNSVGELSRRRLAHSSVSCVTY